MLAQTPPMGWNSWNTFGESINENIIKETADAMVDLGYRDAGYKYVVIDDCWSLRTRDKNDKLVADPEKFPHGIKWLSDYIHKKGLLFGMYSCSGVRTCAGYPSSYGREYLDARTFAEWGVDFLKYDHCNFPESAKDRIAYLTMAQALRASGRDILFSACSWGEENCWEWMRSIGAHMYRSTGDIFDSFESMAAITRSQAYNYNANAAGCFNDTDMLTVGMYGKGNVAVNEVKQSYTEYETQFAYWCATGAPLMIGGDIRNMDDRCRALLQHKGLIALDQDPECRPAYCICSDLNHRTFIRHLANNEFMLYAGNFIDRNRNSHYYFPDMGIPTNCGCSVDITDVISGEHLGKFHDDYFIILPEHSCRVFRCKLIPD